jgi:uncharacterized protein YjeT (DUF2065 family)
MTEPKSSPILRISLIVFAIVALFYGVTYMFIPQFHVQMAGDDVVPSGWLRWFGPILIALGIGTIMVLRKPKKQGTFVKMLAIGTLLCGPTLLYSAFYEYEGIGQLESTIIPAVVLLALSLLLWIGYIRNKELLGN